MPFRMHRLPQRACFRVYFSGSETLAHRLPRRQSATDWHVTMTFYHRCFPKIVSVGHRGGSAVLWFLCCFALGAEPVVVSAELLAPLHGVALSHLFVTDIHGKPIPFQIDEVTPHGEYVLDRGNEPNQHEGNGVLDGLDELVFLAQDASPVSASASVEIPDAWRSEGEALAVYIGEGKRRRAVVVRQSATPPPPLPGVLTYTHDEALLRTPYYYAQFGRDRFHFVNAGVRDFENGRYIDLTNEMRIIIHVRLFWGLFAVTYTEESMVCVVKRYKVGPLRLIRRGDFHLNVGLGVKGSKAAVYQICYPSIVSVPVTVNLPIRFSSFFREAYIEMTPVLREEASLYRFSVPARGVSFPLSGPPLDTLVTINPDKLFFRVDDGVRGYGWLLNTSITRFGPHQSGFLLQRPSSRGGVAHSGYRLTLEDLPKGYYTIDNWVFFSRNRIEGLHATSEAVLTPTVLHRGDAAGSNRIASPPEPLR